MKKYLSLLVCLAMAVMLFAGCQTNQTTNEQSSNQTNTQSSNQQPSVIDTATVFADGDYLDVSTQTPDATITLSGTEGTVSDTTRGSSGSTVTITSKGVYHVTGSAENVTITVNDEKESGNVYLVLDNVSMTNDTSACIYVAAADKVIVQCVGENSLTYTAQSNADGIDGAIYAKDDLTINGSGALSVTSAQHGIVCKDDLKLTGAELTVTAAKIGVQANDSVRIADAAVLIVSDHDGVQVKNDDGSSWFYMESGSLTVDAGYDAVEVGTEEASFTGSLTVNGGSLALTAGGGSDSSKRSTSQKSLKCDGDIYLNGGTLAASSADDAVHAGGSIYASGTVMTLSSSDDGMHADVSLTISGGTVTVTKSYEGLEAETVNILGGEITVYASDDGINAAGGSDTSSSEQGPWSMAAASGTLNISGGTVYVNAGGDGLDSNGSIYVSGGFTVVEGPMDNGNGALDKGDGGSCVASITGGTVLALGSTGMAVNFDTGSQCTALVTLSGNAGDTITVDDGSGFRFTASKSFQCAVYSSPNLQQGNSYTITASSSTATMNFSTSLYYTDVAGMGGHGRR